jgi:hypothetical protein
MIDLEKSISMIAGCDNDGVLAVWDAVKFHAEEIRRLKALAEKAIIEWIENHGDLNAGNGVRYYVGKDKKTKCRNVPGAIDALLTAVGGDMARFAEVLSSDAIKHGAAAKILDEAVWDNLFEVTYEPDLKEGSNKKLMKFDAKFAKGGK